MLKMTKRLCKYFVTKYPPSAVELNGFGVESFFQIDENHTIYKAVVNIDRPTISGFDQCSECTVQ